MSKTSTCLRNLAVFIITSSILALKAEVVKVGLVVPMTGGTATFGQENLNGIKLALEKIKKEKGYGKTSPSIQLVVEDDKSESTEAISAIKKLINVDNVSLVIGEVTTSNTMAMAPIARDKKIPLFSPAATNVDVTKKFGHYISRACFTDDFQGLVMARFAHQNLKLNTSLVVIDNSSDYSKGLAKSFKDEFLKLGGKLVPDKDFSYSKGDNDFSSLIRNIKRANPEVVFLPGYYGEVANIIRLARKSGLKMPFLGGDGWDSPDLFNLANKGGENNLTNSYISSHFTPDDKDPMVANFVSQYEAVYHNKPGAMAALGYDAMLLAYSAIQKAKVKTPDEINNQILATKNFPGVTGIITIDSDRNSKKAAVIVEAKEGKFVFKNRVNP